MQKHDLCIADWRLCFICFNEPHEMHSACASPAIIVCPSGAIAQLFMPLSPVKVAISPALSKFIDWARRDPLAGEVISKAGGVPAFNKKAKKR